MGGGQKFSLRRLQAVGRRAANYRFLGWRFESWSIGCRRAAPLGRAAAMFARPGFEPPTKMSADSRFTVRPLLTLRLLFLPTT